jgi:hypothetical protein
VTIAPLPTPSVLPFFGPESISEKLRTGIGVASKYFGIIKMKATRKQIINILFCMIV